MVIIVNLNESNILFDFLFDVLHLKFDYLSNNTKIAIFS